MRALCAQGYDNGLPYQMERNEVGGWSIDVMMAWPTYLHILPIKGLTNLVSFAILFSPSLVSEVDSETRMASKVLRRRRQRWDP